MKPFYAHLTEQQEDYEYKLSSVENILSPDVMENIRLALGRYGLIKLDKVGVNTRTAKVDDEFTDYPFMPIYTLKAIFANPLTPSSAIQSVALFTRIKDSKLSFVGKDEKIELDGADKQQHAHPVEVDSKFSQDEVGDARAQSLVSDLMKEIAAKKESEVVELDVYEGFVTSHTEINKATGERVRAGFYTIEALNESTVMTGPFDQMLDNYEFRRLSGNMHIIRPLANDGDLMEYAVDYEEDQQDDPTDAGRRLRGQVYKLSVTDQDTGASYKVAVRAHSEEAARAQAIELIADKHGSKKDALLSLDPEQT